GLRRSVGWEETRGVFGTIGRFSVFPSSSWRWASSAGMLNHSTAFSAAAWMVTFSIRAMKSRTLPPCLHSLKQFQMFLEMLTRNWVGFSPLWIGHGPLRLSPLLLKRSSRL